MKDSGNQLMREMGIDSTRNKNINWRVRAYHFVDFFNIENITEKKQIIPTLMILLITTFMSVIFLSAFNTGIADTLFRSFGMGAIPLVITLSYTLLWTFTRKQPNSLLPFYYILISVMLVSVPFSAMSTFFLHIGSGGMVGINAIYSLTPYLSPPLISLYIITLSVMFMCGWFMLIPVFKSVNYTIYTFVYGKVSTVVDEIPEMSPQVQSVPVNNVTSNIKPVVSSLSTLLTDFGLKDVIEIRDTVGPMVTEHVMRLPQGMKVTKVLTEQDNISNSLGVESIMISSFVHGEPRAISIQVPRKQRDDVLLMELMQHGAYTSSEATLPMIVGRSMNNLPIIIDLTEMKHILVGGKTGAGKSKLVESMLISLLLKVPPSELDLIIVDPKQIEMTAFSNVPHLCRPIVTDPVETQEILLWLTEEMETRFSLIAEMANSTGKSIRNIKAYNENITDQSVMKYLVVCLDEYADIIMSPHTDEKMIESYTVRLAQKARAVGIHLILATQRPTVDVITGLIKANMPCRIALSVSSAIDSRVILDTTGAENLLGNGDALITADRFGSKPFRVHGAYIKDELVQKELNKIQNNTLHPN